VTKFQELVMQRKQSVRFLATLGTILGLALLLSCRPAPPSNANANSPAISRTFGTRTSENANTGVVINAREPEKYSATLQLSIETEGADKAAGALSVQIARDGNDRRFEFTLPDGSPLIYFDHNSHHYVILPSRKQYAELPDEQTDKLLTPDQLIEDLKSLTGVERAGEGAVNGRTAEKYRYRVTTDQKASDAKDEAFIYVDKETGLPLRAEKLPRRSSDAKGGKTTRVVIEMRDIKTDVDASLFELPAGYARVVPEKVRPQIEALTNEFASALKAMMVNASNPEAAPAASVSPKSN
jgi:outer membrane lipoprotein-sorting protein